MNVVVFTYSGEGIPIAWKLQKEGVSVTVAQIQDRKDILTSIEEDDCEGEVEKSRRLSLGKGLVDVHPADEVLKALLQVKNPGEYFLLFDFNHCFKYAEALMGKGFMGNFPTEEDRLLEVDRDKAKAFVKKFYPDLVVAPVHEFKTVEEGKKFLETSEDLWVLKGLDEDCRTVVPSTDDPEKGREILVSALDDEKESYEKAGFILELMIANPVEVTPEFQFYNGKPVAAYVDLENKRIGAGDIGVMTGCAQDLVWGISFDSPLARIACPKKVYEMAKEHEGWFIWDASILFDPKTGVPYFGEFCSNRPGYNSLISEIALCGGVQEILASLTGESVSASEAESEYASSVRVFNIIPTAPDGKPIKKELPVGLGEDNVWPFDASGRSPEDEPGVARTVGYCWDVAYVTGRGRDPFESAHVCYENLKKNLTFEGAYYRPLEDYLSTAYPTSIINRYLWLKEKNLM